jgi:hypothetical protein
MAIQLSYLAGAGWQFFDNNGVPLSGGKLYVYQAGTTTPVVTFTSSAGNIQNANPVVLNSSGRTPQQIWLTEGALYKFVLEDSSNALIWTNDNIPAINDMADLANSSDPTKGDALVGFRQSNAGGNLAGSVGSTVHKKLQEIINVRDFGAVGDNTTDDSAAFQAAVTALANAESGVINVPPGAYYIVTPVALASNVRIQGAGIGATTLRCAKRTSSNVGSTLSQSVFTSSGINNISIYDIAFDGDVPSGLNSDNLNPQGLLSFATTTNITVERCTFTKFFASLPVGYVYSDATYQLAAIFMYDCSVINVKDVEYLSPTYGNLTMVLESDNITFDGLRSTFTGNGTTIINETPINIWGETTQNVTIENCVFKNTAGSAINLGGMGNFIVQNNRFTSCNSPIDLSNENWVNPATHPEVYNIIVQNNIIIDPAGATAPIQVGDVRSAQIVSTHEVVIANNQVQMTTSVTASIVVGNSNFVTITGNTFNGGAIQSLYNDLITINNNVLNGRNAAGSNKSAVLYYCRTAEVLSYGYIKNNVISYWQDGAVEVLGFFGAPYSNISISDNEFVFAPAPTNGQYITVSPSGGNPAYRPGILMINNNRLNMLPYVPFRDTDTEIYAISLQFGTPTIKLGSFTRDMTLATGTQAVTGLGFKPRYIMFFANVLATGQASIGMGALPNTASNPFSAFTLNSRTATSPGTWGVNSGVALAWQSASDYYTGTLSTLDSDGFTMSWTKTGSTTGTLDVTYIAFQ